MATINYKFADGHTEEIEVSEDFALQYELIDDQFRRNEKRAEKRNKRKHVSLEYAMANGWDKIDENALDPLESLICKEQSEEMTDIIALSDFLTDRQRQIMGLYYQVGYTKTEIAKVLKLNKSTVIRHLRRGIKKVLKNFSENH